jgi:plasmid maintenance system antidote protein VapI
MADEHTNGTDETPKSENEVVLSQSKLDKLIDKGFSKGANRAKSELAEQLGVDSIEQARELINAKRENDEANKSDLDKAAELINTLNSTIKGLEANNNEIKADMAVQKVVSENGIKDADYFKHLLATASASEGFEQDAFIEQLKGDKPYLFSGGEVTQPKKVDATSNRASLDVGERVKSARTMAELYALQNEL